MSNEALSNLLHEERTFPPSEEFAAAAVAKADLYDEAAKDRLGFWEQQADRLQWESRWDDVLDWRAAVREVVRRRHAQRRRQLRRPARRGRATATGSRSTGRASPATPGPSPTPS